MGKNLNSVSEEDKSQVKTKVERDLEERISAANKQAMEAFEESQSYNENIAKHEKRYKDFKPLDKILVRIYRRLPKIISVGDTSLIVDTDSSADYAKVMRQAATGQNFTARQVPAEFKFSTKAVVVAVPEYETRIKPDDVVCIEQLLVQAVAYDGGEEINYQFSFTHPDSNKPVPPSNPNDVDYGYALVPSHVIKGIV